jgi:hypothetical protein
LCIYLFWACLLVFLVVACVYASTETYCTKIYIENHIYKKRVNSTNVYIYIDFTLKKKMLTIKAMHGCHIKCCDQFWCLYYRFKMSVCTNLSPLEFHCRSDVQLCTPSKSKHTSLLVAYIMISSVWISAPRTFHSHNLKYCNCYSNIGWS